MKKLLTEKDLLFEKVKICLAIIRIIKLIDCQLYSGSIIK